MPSILSIRQPEHPPLQRVSLLESSVSKHLATSLLVTSLGSAISCYQEWLQETSIGRPSLSCCERVVFYPVTQSSFYKTHIENTVARNNLAKTFYK